MPDLLTVGPGTVVREDSAALCYRAEAGRIRLGRVTLGANVVVSEKTVLDIDTAIGDGGRLGHCSSLQPGQRVPTGQYWHGSPAQPADAAPPEVPPARCGSARRFWFSMLQLANLFLLAPIGFVTAVELSQLVPWTAKIVAAGAHSVSDPILYAQIAGISLALFYGGMLTALAFVLTVPRLVHKLFVRPDEVHALYGIRYWAHRFVRRTTNVTLFNDMLGDSSFIVGYLTAMGYDLSEVQQTGSNFGSELRQDTPYLTRIGTGTMVSDGRRAQHGRDQHVLPHVPGEHRRAQLPGQHARLARRGAGRRQRPARDEGRATAGRPGPPRRRAARLARLRDPADGAARRGRAARLRRPAQRPIRQEPLQPAHHRPVHARALVRGVRRAGHRRRRRRPARRVRDSALAAGFLAATAFGLTYAVLVERIAGGFRRLTPKLCSIYDPYFRWHERLWKLLATPPFAGTPFKPLLARMLGVRIGRRVLDLGCSMPEKTLVEIGDHVTLNEGTIIQCHSLEDGVFKSDRTVLGSGVTVGVAAFVHYGVSVGDGAVIGADSFLMKGEEVEPAARWAGNPAREVPEAAELPSLPAARRSAVVPLVLAGLVAVALPAGVTIGMTGTNLPFVPAALTTPPPRRRPSQRGTTPQETTPQETTPRMTRPPTRPARQTRRRRTTPHPPPRSRAR